jgi:ribonuclease D
VQLSRGEGGGVIDAFEHDPTEFVKWGATQGLVAHNASFEELWLREALGIEVPAMHDTILAYLVLQQVASPRSPQFMPHKLEHVAKELLDEDLDKGEQTSDWSAPVLTGRQKAYALKDAQVLVPPHG